MRIDTIKAHFSIIRTKVDYPLFDILFGSICVVIARGFASTFLAIMSGFLRGDLKC